MKGEGIPLSNFEGGPGVPLLKFRAGLESHFQTLRGSRGSRSRGPGPTFTPYLRAICKVIISFNPLEVDDH